ncbi:hypothetical protein PHMEG_00022797 [Phytophthora megakarya]|uniref:Uncharacterized protein n=1 Tax=Phytophthora megakarya TaxID=4795 RepID=A0A225VIB5_9STRA|nr:hypothetical protein PHMEG_00022797 [Phytophthora megakarya]
MTGASEFQEQLSAYCRSEQPPYSVFLMVSKNNAPPPPFQPEQVESDSEDPDPASGAEADDEGGAGEGNKPVGGGARNPNPASASSTPPKKPSSGHSGPAKKARVPGEGFKKATVPGEDSLPSASSKDPLSTPPPSSQANSLLRPVPETSEANLLGHLFDAMGRGETEEERRTPQEEKRKITPWAKGLGCKTLPGPRTLRLRASPDQLLGCLWTGCAKSDPWSTIPNSDADPVRSLEELTQVLTRSKVEDIHMDVLEYWQMDTDCCTLTDAENAIQGRTAEDIVVHVSLRKNVLVEFLRRALILSFLNEVLWFKHVPEEFFDRALTEAEDDDWELGIAEGVNPWPSMPLQPRDSPSASEHEEDASGDERDGNGLDDETSLGKRSRPKSKTPAGKRPKRLTPLTPSPGKSSSSRTPPREKTAPALSDVSSNDETDAPRRVKTLPWTPEMGYEGYHTDTRLVKSWIIYNTRVRRTSTRHKHQNRGFPDYEVMNDEVHSVAERVPVTEYQDIIHTQAPWGDMFDERVRVLLFARETLTPGFVVIAKRYVLFMWGWCREEWERTHWIVLNRNVEAHALLNQDRAGRQRKYERARKDVQADVVTLPPPERKLFRMEAAFWRHSRKPCVWIPMDPAGHKSLRVHLDILDQREPARLYWGPSCPEERIAESVSPAVWGTRVTIHANRLPVPEPEE